MNYERPDHERAVQRWEDEGGAIPFEFGTETGDWLSGRTWYECVPTLRPPSPLPSVKQGSRSQTVRLGGE